MKTDPKYLIESKVKFRMDPSKQAVTCIVKSHSWNDIMKCWQYDIATQTKPARLATVDEHSLVPLK